VRAAGYAGAVRYLRKEPYQGTTSTVVPINVAEYNSLASAGCGVAFVYEHIKPNRSREGRAAGVHDGQWALARALEIVPVYDLRCIYGAVDYDAPGSDFPGIIEYARGWNDVLNVQRTGMYGKKTVLDALKVAGVASRFWQTVAWSGGARFADANLYQHAGYVNVGGVQCDASDILKPDWGQVSYQVSPTPATQPTPREDDTMLIKYPGGIAILNGGFITGVDAAAADGAVNPLANFPVYVVNQATFDELLRSSEAQRSVPAKLDAILAAQKAEGSTTGGVAPVIAGTYDTTGSITLTPRPAP